MDIVGYSYQQERSFDTLEGAANNPGSMSSGLMGAGIGLGMGVGMGGAMGTQFGGITNVMNTNDTKECPSCKGRIGASERFCHLCGCDTSAPKKEAKKETEIKCSNCGTAMTEHTKFCPECGNRYNPCSNCKADIPDGAKVCPICGTKVPSPCPNCGHILTGNSKFCPECGHSLVKKCSNCGKEIEGSTKFCPECGTPIS